LSAVAAKELQNAILAESFESLVAPFQERNWKFLMDGYGSTKNGIYQLFKGTLGGFVSVELGGDVGSCCAGQSVAGRADRRSGL
jgi:hypothetical protein